MQFNHTHNATVSSQPETAASKPGLFLPLVFTLLPPFVLIFLFHTAMLPLLGPGVLLLPALPLFPVGAGVILGWRTGKSLPVKVRHSVAWILGCSIVSGSLLKLGLYLLSI